MKKIYLEPNCDSFFILTNVFCGSEPPVDDPNGPGVDLAPRHL